ncbi:hypothetical protein N0V90_009733 [Kalmusia sp. IMI 367209]|nr:hypothetical protein N0V90_009733 [Kalmusia sp. IMI 367209]
MGLAQSCSVIQKEFRPLWMQVHRIPLCNVRKYLRTFYPARPKTDEAYYSAIGTLRIFLHQDELMSRDLLPLVKHKLAFPNFEIQLENCASVGNEAAVGLQTLLENRHPQWRRWIKGRMITQIRLETASAGDLIYLVVRNEYAEDWMKPVVWNYALIYGRILYTNVFGRFDRGRIYKRRAVLEKFEDKKFDECRYPSADKM